MAIQIDPGAGPISIRVRIGNANAAVISYVTMRAGQETETDRKDTSTSGNVTFQLQQPADQLEGQTLIVTYTIASPDGTGTHYSCLSQVLQGDETVAVIRNDVNREMHADPFTISNFEAFI